MITKLGAADSFTLGRNGMVRNERVHINRGTIVYAFGYGMSKQTFVVCDDNMTAVEVSGTEKVSRDEIDSRYFSPRHKLDETTRPISQKFGIGFYYDESDDIVPDEVIEVSVRHADNYYALKAQMEEEKKLADEQLRKDLVTEYPHLQVCGRYDHRTCGKNIRAELKKHFPKTKFSVRYSSFSGNDAYDITWQGATPTQREVYAVVDKFSDMHPDPYSMGDFWDCKPTIFNELFGSVGYVSCSN